MPGRRPQAADARARAAEANKSAESANAVREKLRGQLNSVLATSESARGLIVNMSDVLFDTGKYTLKPGTQISLAKVSGILQSYPGLKLQVEGYTDSVGSDEFNQKLSENRADAVRDFLVSQGVSRITFRDRLWENESCCGQQHGAGRAAESACESGCLGRRDRRPAGGPAAVTTAIRSSRRSS